MRLPAVAPRCWPAAASSRVRAVVVHAEGGLVTQSARNVTLKLPRA